MYLYCFKIDNSIGSIQLYILIPVADDTTLVASDTDKNFFEILLSKEIFEDKQIYFMYSNTNLWVTLVVIFSVRFFDIAFINQKIMSSAVNCDGLS